MTAFDTELALERSEGAIAAELPAHMRAFAAAYAAGQPAPTPPPCITDMRALAVARRALGYTSMFARARELARLVGPSLIEADPSVMRARSVSDRTWPALLALASARDAACRSIVGQPFLETMHVWLGVRATPGTPAAAKPHYDPRLPALDAVPPKVAGWDEPDGEPATTLEALVTYLSREEPLARPIGILRTDARPRAFIIEPRREVIVVVPRSFATPRARFEALHELGHAFHALAAKSPPPRVLDEAMAALFARRQEDAAHLPPGWASPLAAPARARRRALAVALAHAEASVARGVLPSPLPTERPPWALWHDPGAQAVYVAAEATADKLWARRHSR